MLKLWFSATAQFLEIPGSLKDSQLHVWPNYPNRPKSFAWLTGAGVYYGQLGFGDHEPGESLFLEKELIPYTSELPSEMTPPMGMALTQFHCLLFYRDRLVQMSIFHLPHPSSLPPPPRPYPSPPPSSLLPLPPLSPSPLSPVCLSLLTFSYCV